MVKLGEEVTRVLGASYDAALATVAADPATCRLQFNPVGTAKFTSSCDLAKAALAGKVPALPEVHAVPSHGGLAILVVDDNPNACAIGRECRR